MKQSIETLGSDVVYTPSEIVTLGSEYLKHKRQTDGAGIWTGINSLDKFLNPLVPGDLETIIARPGNGKTGFMMWRARQRAKWLIDNHVKNKVVVYATWEQSIEELYAFNVAAENRLSVTNMARGKITDDEWNGIMSTGSERIGLPLWFIGHSVSRRRKRPNLTLSLTESALTSIENWQTNKDQVIDCIFIDYLQRIRPEGKTESKTVYVSDHLDMLKDMAFKFGCPITCGVQSRREVDKYDFPVPMMDDGQWTSNVEQASDRVISLVRPCVYKQEGADFDGVKVKGHNQLFFSLLKQKLGETNKTEWLYFAPEYNKLDELEIKNVRGDDE